MWFPHPLHPWEHPFNDLQCNFYWPKRLVSFAMFFRNNLEVSCYQMYETKLWEKHIKSAFGPVFYSKSGKNISKLSALCLFQLNIVQDIWRMLTCIYAQPVNWHLKTEGQIFAFLTQFEKLSRRSQSFAQRHFYRVRFCRPSFHDSTTRSLIYLKVSHMLKINYIYEVLLSEWNTCLPKLIISRPKRQPNIP